MYNKYAGVGRPHNDITVYCTCTYIHVDIIKYMQHSKLIMSTFMAICMATRQPYSLDYNNRQNVNMVQSACVLSTYVWNHH